MQCLGTNRRAFHESQRDLPRGPPVMRIDYGLKCMLEQFKVYIPRRGIQTRVYLGATVDHENEAGDAGGW